MTEPERPTERMERPKTEVYPALPVYHLNAALPHLRRPFTVEAVKFRPGGGGILPYIDARVVIERLNAVIWDWRTEFEILPTGKQIVCHLTIEGVTRSDVGTMGGGGGGGVDPVKAGYSDALKRAAVHFGVGVSIYSLKRIREYDLPDGSLKEVGQNKTKVLTDTGETWLRRGYRNWLEGPGKHFGEVLDHGDIAGSVGDEAEATGEPSDELAGMVVETQPEYMDLLAEITKLYGELTAEQKKGLGPAKFKANLKAAGGSEDDLRKLKANLEERRAK